MKKNAITLLLALGLALSLASPAWGVEREDMETAAALLCSQGLFQGTGTDELGFPRFELDKAPTRAEGITMLVRLLGGEEEALAQVSSCPFQDVPAWAVPYVSYAYGKGLTQGTDAAHFDPDSPLGATEYLSFVLRALGYTSGKDFQWDSAWTLTDKLKLTNKDYDAQTLSFTRGDLAWVSWRSLEQKPKGQSKALWQVLGLEDPAGQCWWEEEVESCQPGRFVLSFTALEHGGKKPVYTKFTVESAAINGVPCRVEQYSSAKAVKDHLKEREKELGTLTLEDAFALVYLSYDEDAARAASVGSQTLNGVDYPLLVFELKAVGTLSGGKEVEETVRFAYYLNGYGGRL